MKNIEIKLIEYNTHEYNQELELRDKVLRKPLGLDLFSEDLSYDEFDVHIAAFSGSNIVGCLLLKEIDKNTIKMRQVAVSDDFQKLGIGSKMVGYAEKHAINNGYSTITMHARKTAVKFYNRLGYWVVSDEFNEVNVPHYAMKKDLMDSGSDIQNNLEMKKVTLYTLYEYIEILKDASYWMISKGFKNWDPANFTKDRILDSNNLNELFICYKNDTPVGCIKLQEKDDMFWPDAKNGEALYIHKLAVKREVAGKGISLFMLEWAVEQSLYRKKKYLRLDCISNRLKLCGLYTKHGFVKIDERQVLGSLPSARFEKRV